MSCYKPLHAFRVYGLGGKKISFSPSWAQFSVPLTLPCSRCIGCRLERSRQWAMRCVHEASLYSDNCFITLTYDDENLPKDRSLKKPHFQKFMKRLRKRFGSNIRFYHCGEYGEQTARPHYHACLFNFDFPDKELFKVINGHNLYISKALEELWPFGYSTVGSMTFESAAYVSRYIMKKQLGKNSKSAYERIDWETGEVTFITPEYNTMSRRPGIAASWFKQFFRDVFPKDYVTFKGKKMKPPKYYCKQFELSHPEIWEDIKERRKEHAKKQLDNNTPERLDVRNRVAQAALKKLPRVLE